MSRRQSSQPTETLVFKPHSVRVFRAHEDVDADTRAVEPVTTGPLPASASVRCKVEPIASTTIVERYGVYPKDPRRLMCELADGARFQIGDRVEWQETRETFRVMLTNLHRSDPLTQYAEIIMDLEQTV